MAVLTLAGGAINWAKPPKPTDRVMWSKRDAQGRAVTGSLRTIAHLDFLNDAAKRKFKSEIVVLQPPYNKGVAASAGTHDEDACVDCYIPGVPWRTQETFLRARGAGAYWRRPEQGFGNHIHYFTLPPLSSTPSVSDDYRAGGFTVGKYVDGGYSLYGRQTTSSQIGDYYAHLNALKGHAPDDGWFPPSIAATIFDLNAYIASQRKTMPKKPRPLGLSWNLLTGREPKQVKKELTNLIRANQRPAFVAVQEASTYRAQIKAIAREQRYQRFQPANAEEKPPGVQAREGGSTALLVRNGVKVREHGVIRCAETWLGPWHGRVREGRVLPWAVAWTDGTWTLIVAVHMPTGKNGRNKKAWNETIGRIESLAEAKRLPYILIGDWNDRWTSTDARSPHALAQRTGGKVVHTNTNIDYALVKGHSVKITKGSKRGSDHPAIRVNKKG